MLLPPLSLLALVDHPPVLADAASAAACGLTLVDHPPVLAGTATAAVLAFAVPSPVLADTTAAAAVLALVALPPVLADTATVLAPAGRLPVLTRAAAASMSLTGWYPSTTTTRAT